MASKMTNEAVAALKRRQAAELEALVGAESAAEIVGRARQRRADELERLDAAVGEAEQGEDLALAVLATLVPPDVAAGLAGVTPARVRQAQQRAPVEEVGARVQTLADGAPVPRLRGRPRGSGRPAGRGGGRRPGGAPLAQDEQSVGEQRDAEQGSGHTDDGGVSADAGDRPS